MKKNEPILEFECDNCDMSFPTELGLNIHTGQMHKNLENDEQISGFKCSVCDKSFATEFGLKKHLTITHKFLKYKCDQCDKEF